MSRDEHKVSGAEFIDKKAVVVEERDEKIVVKNAVREDKEGKRENITERVINEVNGHQDQERDVQEKE